MFGNGNIVLTVVIAVISIALISWGVHVLVRRISHHASQSAPVNDDASGADAP